MIGILIAVAACGTGCAGDGGSERSDAPLRLNHAGQWFVDEQGRVVVLHGVNMVRKRETYAPSDQGFDADDIEFLVAQGFNSLRLGVIWKGLEPNPGEYDYDYLDKILSTARLAGEAGLWVLLDFHQDMYNEKFEGQGMPDWAVFDDDQPLGNLAGHPDNYTGSPALSRAYDHFWRNTPGPDGRGLADALADAWGVIARQARDLPGLLGYEIMNEPWPGGDRWVECVIPGRTCASRDLLLYEAQRKAVKNIREHDSRSMVFYEPWVSFNFGVDTTMPDFEDDRAGFAYHKYCLIWPCNEHVMAHALRRSEETGDALLLTEYMDLDAEFRAMLIESFASWHFWAWRAYDCCHREYGIIHRLGEAPTPDNLDQNILDSIVQPYARAIAGTPIAAAYDFEARRYTLEYAPTPIGGSEFGDTELTTEIFVPERHYPAGYAAQVVNGTVVSREDEPFLQVTAALAAESVVVEVVPR
jgi:endoglycosylceramidase